MGGKDLHNFSGLWGVLVKTTDIKWQMFTVTINRHQRSCGQGVLPAIPVLQDQAISHCSRLQWCALRGIQGGGKQGAFCSLDTGPRQLRCISKE